MIALRLHGIRDLRVHEEPLPAPGPDELLVRVTAVGLCGSDLHWFAEGAIGDAALERPLVLGHEFAGVVVGGARAGERVALDPAIPCGHCPACVAGDPHLCLDCRFAGHGAVDGALREHVAWPARLAVAVPDSVDDTEAAMLEPLGVALHALDLADVRPGAAVGVFGCGPLGLLLVRVLRLRGVEVVVATDALRHRADAAVALGASAGLELRRGASEILPSRLRARGLDVAFEVAGDDGALATAVETVRPGGKVVLVGIPSDDRHGIPAGAARRKGLAFVLCRRMRPAHLERAAALAARHRLDLAALVSDRYPLARGAEAFAAAEGRAGLKVVVEPQREAA